MSQKVIFYKLKCADFKYDNTYLKFQPKNTKIKHICSQIQAFLFFHKIVQLDKIEGTDFKYDKIKFQPKNIQVNHIVIQIKVFLFLHEIMQLDEFKSTDFNYDNSIFKFQTRTPQIKHFWSPNSKEFYFCTEHCSQTNLRVLISNTTTAFSKFQPKIPK